MSRIEGPRGTIGKACRVACVVKKVLSMQYADYSHSGHGLIVPGSMHSETSIDACGQVLPIQPHKYTTVACTVLPLFEGDI